MRYDYECQKCQHVQEVWHGMNEKPKVKCEKCKSSRMKKLIAFGQISMNNHPGSSLDDV